jgi:hypothetical protein
MSRREDRSGSLPLGRADHDPPVSSPLAGWQGEALMRIAREQLPSPLMGEGLGGGEGSAPSPIPAFPRTGGKRA